MRAVRFGGYLLSAVLSVGTSVVTADEGVYLGVKAGGWSSDAAEPIGDLSDIGFGFFGGYQLSDYMAVEAEFMSLQDDSVNVSGVDLSVGADIWAISLMPMLPVGDNGDLFAKVGYGTIDGEASASALGASVTESDTSDGWLFGVGGQWTSGDFLFRGEVQFDTDVPDFMIYTVGFGYQF